MLPLPKAVPPDAAENHEMVPIDDEALKETVPDPQRLPGVVDVKEGVSFIVM